MKSFRAQGNADKNEKQLFRVGWLIDGSGGPVQKNRTLTVENGTIVGIDSWKEGDAPEDIERFTDLSSNTVFPPLVDCHVHLAVSGSTEPRIRKTQAAVRYGELKRCIPERLHQHLCSGVLAVRDGGDRNGYVLRYKNEDTGPVIVKAADRPWHQQGRYGVFGGQSPGKGETLGTAFARSNGAGDHVKLINSGLNSLTEFARETNPQFSTEEMARLVTLAKGRGQKVMVHANGREPVKRAIEAGCHSIEHGFFMGRDNLQRMAERGTVWVPTVVTMKALLADVRSGGVEGSEAVIAETLEHQLEQLSLAREYGVNVALGTDAGCRGVLHGVSAVEECVLMLQAGYSLVEVMRCVSVNGAELLGLDGIGLLAPGRTASFIVTGASSMTLTEMLSSIKAIYISGVPLV